MNRYVARELDLRIAKFESSKRSKWVMDLALNSYLSEKPENNIIKVMDSTSKKFAISQIKLFLFSGHDTTSSSICYLFYVLSQNPSVLGRVRAEHDAVFGRFPHNQQFILSQPAALHSRGD